MWVIQELAHAWFECNVELLRRHIGYDLSGLSLPGITVTLRSPAKYSTLAVPLNLQHKVYFVFNEKTYLNLLIGVGPADSCALCTSLMPANPKYWSHAHRPISHAWQTNQDFLLLKPIKYKFNSISAKKVQKMSIVIVWCLSQLHTCRQCLKVTHQNIFGSLWQCSQISGNGRNIWKMWKFNTNLTPCLTFEMLAGIWYACTK